MKPPSAHFLPTSVASHQEITRLEQANCAQGIQRVHLYRDRITEAEKRNTPSSLEHTLNARPRVRARTGKGSTVQSDGGGGVSGDSGAGSGGQSSGAFSRGSVTSRSCRVTIGRTISGWQPIVKQGGRKALCGLAKCGCMAGWGMSQGAGCVDCVIAHTGNKFLCAACHRKRHDCNRWKHLGPDLRAQAIAWVEKIRAAPLSIHRMLGLGCEEGRARSPPRRVTGAKVYREAVVQVRAGSPGARPVAGMSPLVRARYLSAGLFREGSRLRRKADRKHCAASIKRNLRPSGVCLRGLVV